MLALLALSSASEGAIHVTVAGAGSKSGDSWTNAMSVVEFRATLQDGIEGEYWVAKGTYTPDDDSDPEKSFVLKKNIALYGGFAGTETKRDERDWETNATILSGGAVGGGDVRSYCVVRAVDVDDTAILDGFTIMAGKSTDDGGGMFIWKGSPTVTNCTFSLNEAGYGGGMYIDKSNPKVSNCTFSWNKATVGGGMEITKDSSPTVTDCTFSWNKASTGGGINIATSSPTFTNCTFSGNEASGGGGMFISNGSPTLTNCTFSRNEVNTFGGGLFIQEGDPTVTNCTFSENGANWSGGGMVIQKGDPTVTNCTFSANVASSGGGMIIWKSSPTLTNCTFSANEANDGGGDGMYIRDSNPTLTNSIFWRAGSAAGQIEIESGNPTITYSVVDTALFPDEGNTDADPKLGPLADNGGSTQTCALLEGSSAIDKGLSVGPHTIDGVKIIVPGEDQRGITRPYGVGVDIGAYERDEPPFPKKPGSSGGGCATGPSSPWMLALLAPLAPIALRRRPGITIRTR